jgi:serine/threonine protein kinase
LAVEDTLIASHTSSHDAYDPRYRPGDRLGSSYEVVRFLGQGAFGAVYLVCALHDQQPYALKTLHPAYAGDTDVRGRFEREARIWVELGAHPYIVRAHFVEYVGGQLVIASEYIAPSADDLNSLADYLRRRHLPLRQHLRWAIELCFGMSHAYGRGLKAHRDLKPSNLLIDANGHLRVADFGLASAVSALHSTQPTAPSQDGSNPSHTRTRLGLGTRAYMPPEQWTDAASCDERSDIYSTGIVLFEMATGGQRPFTPLATTGPDEWAYLYYEWHRAGTVPQLDSPLMSIIARCLAKAPRDRYTSFSLLREDLAALLRESTSETVSIPSVPEQGALELHNRAMTLSVLGRHNEALALLDAALARIPWSVATRLNRALALKALGRLQEALTAYDDCLKGCPTERLAWSGKGDCLALLGRPREALDHFDRALTLDPRAARVWDSKGATLGVLDRHDEALTCLHRALELDAEHPPTWFLLANTLEALGRLNEAFKANEEGLRLDPLHVQGWFTQAGLLARLNRIEDGLLCLQRAAELSPDDVLILFFRGILEKQRGHTEAARRSWEEFLRLANDKQGYPWECEYVRARLAALEASSRDEKPG